MPLPYTFPFTLPDGDISTTEFPVLDNPGIALSRLAQYLKDKPNATAIIGLFAARFDDLGTVLSQLFFDRQLGLATDAALDLNGRIVGLPREGLSNERYSAAIRAQIKLLRSSGTVEDILTIFRLLTPAGTTLEIADQPPAGFALRLSGAPTDDDTAAFYVGFLRAAASAGVHCALEWTEAPDAAMFRFDSGPGFDSGHLAGVTNA